MQASGRGPALAPNLQHTNEAQHQLCSVLDAGTARSRPILTSLPLQVFIYFGGWWDVFYWVLSILIFIYKGKCA